MADAVDVVASGGFDCHLMSGCGFPRPELRSSNSIRSFSSRCSGSRLGINKPVILLILVSAFIIFIFHCCVRQNPRWFRVSGRAWVN